jgi:hypothetical protein
LGAAQRPKHVQLMIERVRGSLCCLGVRTFERVRLCLRRIARPRLLQSGVRMQEARRLLRRCETRLLARCVPPRRLAEFEQVMTTVKATHRSRYCSQSLALTSGQQSVFQHLRHHVGLTVGDGNSQRGVMRHTGFL